MKTPADPASGFRGYAQVLLAASLWGSSGIFATFLFRRGMTPEGVALMRPAVALAFLALAALGLRAWRVSRRGMVWIAGAGGLATGVFQLAYQSSVAASGVPVTVALLYLSPAIVLVASGPLLGERHPARRYLFAAVSLAGVWLTVLGATGLPTRSSPGGWAWGVLAAVGYAAYTLVGRYTAPRWGGIATALYSTAGGSLVLAIALPLSGRAVDLPSDAATWAILASFAFLTMALAAVLFYDGLRHVEAGAAAIASTIEPVAAALLATALLEQGLTLLGWCGLVLVVVGVAGSYAGSGAR